MAREVLRFLSLLQNVCQGRERHAVLIALRREVGAKGAARSGTKGTRGVTSGDTELSKRRRLVNETAAGAIRASASSRKGAANLQNNQP